MMKDSTFAAHAAADASSISPKLLLAVKALVVVIATTTATLAIRPRSQVVLWPLLEDGFYSFTVARNIAFGRGITADGISPTNGFQPLFTFLTVPLFALADGDRHLAVRFVLVLHWIFYVGAAVVLGLAARALLARWTRARGDAVFWTTVFVYLANPLIFQAHFNGLETGCALFLYATVSLYALSRRFTTMRRHVLLGVLLGLTILARIDAFFFAAAVCGFFLWFPTNARASLRDRLRAPAIVAFASVLVSSPWWLYNLTVFHSLMPSSGSAQQEWVLSPVRVGAALLTVARLVTPWWARFDPGRFDCDQWADLIRVCLFLFGLVW